MTVCTVSQNYCNVSLDLMRTATVIDHTLFDTGSVMLVRLSQRLEDTSAAERRGVGQPMFLY
jgi:hypothetical protein